MDEIKGNRIYKLEGIDALIKKLTSKGYRVIGPKKEDNLEFFGEIQSGGNICRNQINPNNSIKEFFLPRCEKVLSFKYVSKKVKIKEPREITGKTVIIGAKPCDTASLPILDKLFANDCADKFWFEKRELTTVISIACTKCDEYCFCTSVNLSPNSKKGCDIMLTEEQAGRFFAETVTDKGENLANEVLGILSKCDNISQEQIDRASLKISKVDKKFNHDKVKQRLDVNFENDLWAEFSRQCIGCGTCTFLCPTCHCFDIVDEGKLNNGSRLKNWDACQMKTFTVHTSGHNPRETQDQRWRQRIMHKFRYYVDKFDEILCVGCGRCSRHCPVDMNISECLTLIEEKKDQE